MTSIQLRAARLWVLHAVSAHTFDKNTGPTRGSLHSQIALHSYLRIQLILSTLQRDHRPFGLAARDGKVSHIFVPSSRVALH